MTNKKRLGSVISINPDSLGSQFPYEFINYIDISSINEGNIEKTTKIQTINAPSRARRLVKCGDTILSTVRPNLRAFLYLKNPSPDTVVSTGFAVLRASEKIDSRFLYYSVINQEFTEYLTNNAKGSAYPAVDTETIARAEIPFYSLPLQQKIAAILSAYDDLIENNTRRIKILEEMAQAIYREWFVNFRFPGHEGVRMVESELGPVPEGWEVKRLDDVAEVIDCLHGIKPTEVTNDDEKFGILLHVWNIGEEGKLELSKKFFITEEVYRLWTKRIEVKGGDCVITNVGRIGAVAQIPFDLKAAIGRNMTAIRCREGIITPTYLIEYLRSPYFEREKNLKQDSGTVMGSLNVKGIVRLNIPIPPINLVNEFERMVRPFRYRIEIFQKQNDTLRRTRDLLLPKLISGEFDVSELDIRIPEAEA